MTPARIHHFAINAPTTVIQELVEFYAALLDLKPGDRPDFGIPGHWLYAGEEPILHLIEDDNREPGQTGFFDHIALRCDDLTGIKARLDSLGVEYGEFTIEQTRQHQVFLKDPAGTAIELNFQLS